ncbi:hypothetical protein ACQW02_27845 [Humitalea sp. 24SJ18S-53]|uniref:hypothetical protein n=1 Tax=Humitalea sp. 24SJ18S-53 TaxID=3422307 RepID=UPI003D66BB14
MTDEPRIELSNSRADHIAAVQALLPYGWQIVDEHGAVSILDQHGDYVSQSDDPPKTPDEVAGLLAQVDRLLRHDQENGFNATIALNVEEAIATPSAVTTRATMPTTPDLANARALTVVESPSSVLAAPEPKSQPEPFPMKQKRSERTADNGQQIGRRLFQTVIALFFAAAGWFCGTMFLGCCYNSQWSVFGELVPAGYLAQVDPAEIARAMVAGNIQIVEFLRLPYASTWFRLPLNINGVIVAILLTTGFGLIVGLVVAKRIRTPK